MRELTVTLTSGHDLNLILSRSRYCIWYETSRNRHASSLVIIERGGIHPCSWPSSAAGSGRHILISCAHGFNADFCRWLLISAWSQPIYWLTTKSIYHDNDIEAYTAGAERNKKSKWPDALLLPKIKRRDIFFSSDEAKYKAIVQQHRDASPRTCFYSLHFI